MPQAKKKTVTKTAAKKTARPAKKVATKKTTKKACAKGISNAERWHIYIVTALSMVTLILLCTNIAFMVA